VGTYTLSQFDLKVREQGYVKCDFGPPVQRGDYDALVISQDGAQCLGNIPDQMNKTEVGKSGGGIRYVNIIESTVLNPPVIDNQFDLKTFWEKLNDIEGFTVTWSQSAADAAVKDGEGNSMGAGMAQWTRPGSGHVPYDRFVNNQYQPKCSPRAGTIKIPNGRSFTFYADWNYGYGALETLAATTEDERAPEGTPVAALWVDGGVEVAAGLTDASGYAVVPGVPANGTETFQLQQG